MRKSFTVSERVAIAIAVAGKLDGRAGNPAFRANCGNISTIAEEGKSRDLAAAKAGLGSGKTYEAAKKVVENGAPSPVWRISARTPSAPMPPSQKWIGRL